MEKDSTVRFSNQLTKFTSPNGENVEEIFGSAKGGTNKHSLARITLIPGGKSKKHYHPECEESYHILSGKGKVILNDKESILNPGDSVAIIPETVHQIFNFYEKEGENDLIFIAVCSPPWTPNCSVFLD